MTQLLQVKDDPPLSKLEHAFLIKAVCKDVTRPNLCGIHTAKIGDKPCLAATDGHRLHVVFVDVGFDGYIRIEKQKGRFCDVWTDLELESGGFHFPNIEQVWPNPSLERVSGQVYTTANVATDPLAALASARHDQFSVVLHHNEPRTPTAYVRHPDFDRVYAPMTNCVGLNPKYLDEALEHAKRAGKHRQSEDSIQISFAGYSDQVLIEPLLRSSRWAAVVMPEAF